MDEQRQQTLSTLDRQLLALSRRLLPDVQQRIIRQFICDRREQRLRQCGAVAQPAEQRALNPSIAVRTRAAQVS